MPGSVERNLRRVAGSPDLLVLDSTDPAQVTSFEASIDPARTLFIVSSKSGSTLEPNIFKAYFFDKTKHAVGADKAARHFVAVTDPGSNLRKKRRPTASAISSRPQEHRRPLLGAVEFRHGACAAMGLDVATLLAGAERMLHACGPDVAAENNPGLVLGTILGVAATKGIDKLTIIASPGSTTSAPGSSSSSPSPPARRARESSRSIANASRRRRRTGTIACSLTCGSRMRRTPSQDSAVAALEKAGQPVVTIRVPTKYDLAAEFFRWEIATPIAGAILGINPFNQPDVEASKIATRALTDQYEKTGTLPSEAPFFEGDGIRLFADAANADALKNAVGAAPSLTAFLKAHLGRIGKGDYFAVLGYIPMTAAYEDALQTCATASAIAARARRAWVRPAFPALDRSGVQGRTEQRGLPAGHLRRCRRTLPVPGQRYTFGV